MPRLHLFELEDQAWFPALIRDAGTAYLGLASAMAGHADAMTPHLARALRETGESHIIDLCSGGAGPVPVLLRQLDADGLEVNATLTDFFPNEGAFESISAASAGRIDYAPRQVDATAVPRELRGMRTIFNALHHFRPRDARAILRDAVDARAPIAVFEVLSRSATAVLGVLFGPISILLLLPFLRPFRWAWLPLTYVVPVIPLFVLWDGVVSCLRQYTPEELLQLAESLDAPGYRWESGRLPLLLGGMVNGAYLVGLPPREPVGRGRA